MPLFWALILAVGVSLVLVFYWRWAVLSPVSYCARYQYLLDLSSIYYSLSLSLLILSCGFTRIYRGKEFPCRVNVSGISSSGAKLKNESKNHWKNLSICEKFFMINCCCWKVYSINTMFSPFCVTMLKKIARHTWFVYVYVRTIHNHFDTFFFIITDRLCWLNWELYRWITKTIGD